MKAPLLSVHINLLLNLLTFRVLVFILFLALCTRTCFILQWADLITELINVGVEYNFRLHRQVDLLFALSGLTHQFAFGQIVFKQVFLRLLLKNVGIGLRFFLVLLIDSCSCFVDLFQKLNFPQVHQLTDCIDPWMESVLLTPLLLHFLSSFFLLLVKRFLPLLAPLDESGN